MEIRRLLVQGKILSVPEGWIVSHTCLIEPKRGQPYFAVLLTREKAKPKSRVGFRP